MLWCTSCPTSGKHDHDRYSTFKVHQQTFAYLWEPTQTVGLKQTLTEQLALVADRPDVFEVQLTIGQFGWVVVQLARIDRAELAELTFGAWRLTAAAALVKQQADLLPRYRSLTRLAPRVL